MKTFNKSVFLFIPLLVLLGIHPFQITAQQVSISPTPSYNPLVEPPLPENPTEYELGRNLYWHWCMTCHGDRGQGLTDEFRRVWDEDHRNCWGRGCHAGHPGDTGFPIPTVVPALVNESHLMQFASVQELSDFLQATHPPQSPGILKSDEYHAIALFVFTINGRSPVDIPVIDTPALTVTPVSLQEVAPKSFPTYAILIFIILGAAVFIMVRRTHLQNKK